jgi:hypothetical protein
MERVREAFVAMAAGLGSRSESSEIESGKKSDGLGDRSL